MPARAPRRRPWRWDTRAIHDGQEPDPATGAINPPVFLSSTFAEPSPGVPTSEFVYARTGNPTRAALERAIARLESGTAGFAFASGLAATSTLFLTVPAGARIVAGDDLYAGTLRLLTVARRHGVRVDLVDTSNADLLGRTLRDGPPARWLYLETPTNPLLRITDLRRAIREARARGTRVAVDNTFASPYLQHPLELGADLVLHSTTKYLGGHSDLIGGAIVVRDPELAEELRWHQNTGGGVPGPLDCYLVLRGIRTLPLRMRAHCANARAVAAFLDGHRAVRRTLYPGLAGHPGHEVAQRQMDDFGGMVSFELAGGGRAAARVARAFRLFTLAESLGGVESLVNVPARMTHRSVPKAERAARGITDGLLRLSVGIEDAADLLDDLRQALRAA